MHGEKSVVYLALGILPIPLMHLQTQRARPRTTTYRPYKYLFREIDPVTRSAAVNRPTKVKFPSRFKASKT